MEGLAIILLGILSSAVINYLSDILPVYRRFRPPECLGCQNRVGWGRYLILSTCKHCGKKRSARSFGLSLFLPLIILWVWTSPPVGLGFWLGWIVFCYFSLVFIIDLEHRAILHPVSAVGALIGIPVGVVAHGLTNTLLGVLAGAGIMLVLFYFGIGFIHILARIRKQELDETALGFGDVILGGVLGLMTGWPEVTGTIIVAILSAGLISGILIIVNVILKRYKPLLAIPYAPFMLLGATIFIFIPK